MAGGMPLAFMQEDFLVSNITTRWLSCVLSTPQTPNDTTSAK